MNQWPDRVEELVAHALERMGYDLVRLRLHGAAQPTLQVMVERRDGKAMAVDDCADISRAVSALLDVEDPIAGRYTLEVTSPGIDRPLVRAADFERFAGFEARIETSQPVSGRRRFRGKLMGTTPAGVRIALPEGEAEVPFARIHRAKLVLTDALITATERRKGV